MSTDDFFLPKLQNLENSQNLVQLHTNLDKSGDMQVDDLG